MPTLKSGVWAKTSGHLSGQGSAPFASPVERNCLSSESALRIVLQRSLLTLHTEYCCQRCTVHYLKLPGKLKHICSTSTVCTTHACHSAWIGLCNTHIPAYFTPALRSTSPDHAAAAPSRRPPDQTAQHTVAPPYARRSAAPLHHPARPLPPSRLAPRPWRPAYNLNPRTLAPAAQPALGCQHRRHPHQPGLPAARQPCPAPGTWMSRWLLLQLAQVQTGRLLRPPAVGPLRQVQRLRRPLQMAAAAARAAARQPLLPTLQPLARLQHLPLRVPPCLPCLQLPPRRALNPVVRAGRRIPQASRQPRVLRQVLRAVPPARLPPHGLRPPTLLVPRFPPPGPPARRLRRLQVMAGFTVISVHCIANCKPLNSCLVV